MYKLVVAIILSFASLLVVRGFAKDPLASPSLHNNLGLLAARESVWRAWFANDQKALKKILPEDTIAINNGEEKWETREEVLQGAAQFASHGGRLLRLEFPHTEIRRYGDVAVLYSLYLFETETQGERQVSSGRATEVFLLRNGVWQNPGWHLDSGK